MRLWAVVFGIVGKCRFCLKILPACVTDPRELKRRTLVLWGHVKDELYHYKLGSKLLWMDMNTSTQLLKRVFSGHTLSRRERQQLLKTSADMFRLVRLTATCTHMYIQLYRHTYLHTYMHAHIPMLTCVHTCLCTCIHIHTYLHALVLILRSSLCFHSIATCRCPSQCSSLCRLWSSCCRLH